MGGGGFASRESLNLNFRKSKKNADSEKEKSEKSTEQNLYLEKNSNSKKSEKSSYEKKLKFSKIALRNFQKNRNPKTFQQFLAQKNLLKKFLKQKFYRLKFLQNFYSEFLRKILNRLNLKRYFFENSSHGTILIEFAFCVPVLILLLLYINDIMILARTQDEMKRAAYCAVQLIQNVSKCRNSDNRKITQNDIKNINRAWTIMVPAAQKAIGKANTFVPLFLILVEGTGDDRCKVKWSCHSHFTPDGIISSTSHTGSKYITHTCASSFHHFFGQKGNLNQDIPSTSLCKDFHIKNGEIKVIVEINIQTAYNDTEILKIFGLRILKRPLNYLRSTHDHTLYFDTHVIFKPINGIFSTTEPPK